MKIIESKNYKIARRGESIPVAFQPKIDRTDEYQRYRKPNSGDGYKYTIPFTGPLSGEPEGFGFSAVSPTKDVLNFDTKSHPLSENGSPDELFGDGSDSDSDFTQYGDGGYGQQFAEDSSPLSRNMEAFLLGPDSGSLEQKLMKKRSL